MKYDAQDAEKQQALMRAQEKEHGRAAHAPYGKNDYRLDDDVVRKSGYYDNDIGSDALVEFVAWLADTRLVTSSDLPACWPKHPEVCDTLAALLSERAQAVSETASSRAMVVWHEDLQKIRSFWPQWLAACRTKHQEPVDVVLKHDNTGAGA
jgi:hypothetical protein